MKKPPTPYTTKGARPVKRGAFLAYCVGDEFGVRFMGSSVPKVGQTGIRISTN
jgi:hypothetical protein